MISITEIAAERIKKFISNREKGLGIRVGIKTTGCSGLAYVLEFVDQPEDVDEIFESNGVTVYVNPKSLIYVTGLTIDYTKKGLNEGFEFINPNERDRCGCGESFRV
jgi:iron-sulfur cluster assembly protein